jgi:tripartite-type tricarboxylate transporter receptor subunit TctC
MCKVWARLRAAGLWLAIAAAYGLPAQAQDYPTGPVKLVTQGAPGSGPDVIARIVADHLGRLWGQQVLVLSHPGAAGSVRPAWRPRRRQTALRSTCPPPPHSW